MPAALVALAAWRFIFPGADPDLTGPRAIADAVFALGLLALVLTLASAVGQRILEYLRILPASPLLKRVLAVPIGLGTISLGLTAMGFIGWFHTGAIVAWLGLLGLLVWRAWVLEFNSLLCAIRPRRLLELRGESLALGVPILLIASLALVEALAPPWAYDALMYHLEAPSRFLELGRVSLLPENWPANGPMAIDMLFAIGLAFRSDIFAQLLNLVTAGLMACAVYACGEQILGRRGGLLAAAVLVAIPIFPAWASWAYSDIGAAVYEFLALLAILSWRSDRRQSWLLLAGLYAGLAVGSKYLALATLAVLLGVLLFVDWRRGLRAWLASALLLGVVALVVGSPWYFKNLVLAGNPVFPFVFGGPGWNRQRVDLLVAYHRSFSTGHGLLDYVLLPWNIYVRHGVFTTFGGRIELPSPLFPLAVLSPVFRHPGLGAVALFAVLRAVLWALGSQQIRHLLPVFPALSILTAGVFMGLLEARRWPTVARVFVRVAIFSAMAVTLAYSVIYLLTIKPYLSLVGAESKRAFLGRVVEDFDAMQAATEVVPSGTYVFQVWDARSYYCAGRCIPDADHAGWARLVAEGKSPEGVSLLLRNLRARYLMVSLSDASFILHHDPTGIQRKALDFLLNDFIPMCGRVVYSDDQAALYEVICK